MHRWELFSLGPGHGRRETEIPTEHRNNNILYVLFLGGGGLVMCEKQCFGSPLSTPHPTHTHTRILSFKKRLFFHFPSPQRIFPHTTHFSSRTTDLQRLRSVPQQRKHRQRSPMRIHSIRVGSELQQSLDHLRASSALDCDEQRCQARLVGGVG